MSLVLSHLQFTKLLLGFVNCSNYELARLLQLPTVLYLDELPFLQETSSPFTSS